VERLKDDINNFLKGIKMTLPRFVNTLVFLVLGCIIFAGNGCSTSTVSEFDELRSKGTVGKGSRGV
jgi:hypothetical protein